jgi:hypothetical protein
LSEPRQTLRQGIRELPRPVWILCAGSFVVFAPGVGAAVFDWSPDALWLLCGGLGAVSALLLLGSGARPDENAHTRAR